jgi:hypothetical protein
MAAPEAFAAPGGAAVPAPEPGVEPEVALAAGLPDAMAVDAAAPEAFAAPGGAVVPAPDVAMDVAPVAGLVAEPAAAPEAAALAAAAGAAPAAPAAPPTGEFRNLAFWDSVDLRDALCSPVPTREYIPRRYAGEVTDLRAALLTELAACEPMSADAERLWKLLSLFDRLLFQSPTTKQRRSRRADSVLSRRLTWFVEGDWEALLRDTADHSAGARTTRRTVDPEVRLVARVEALFSAGETSRAVAALLRDVSSGVDMSPEERFDALAELFPDAPPGAVCPPRGVVGDAFRSAVEDAVVAGLKQAPRKSSPGPLGARYEHYRPLLRHSSGSAALGVVVARLVLGELPASVHAAHLAAAVTPLPKKIGGVRPIACGSVLRRLGARAACVVTKDLLRDAAGPSQFAIGRAAGCELLQRVLAIEAERRPGAAFVAVDFRNAFNSVYRHSVVEAVAARAGTLLPVAQAMYASATEHVVRTNGDGGARFLPMPRGVDQGCPLSPAFFALALVAPLARAESRLRVLDPQAKIFAYLDDVTYVVDKAVAGTAQEIVAEEFSRVGLELRPTKTQVWSPSGSAGLPAVLLPAVVPAMPCLGATVQYVDAAAEAAGVEKQEARQAPLETALASLREVHTRLERAMALGLALDCALVLHRTYVNNAITHILRSHIVPVAWCEEWDTAVAGMYASLLRRELPATALQLLFLPLRDGGVGLQGASPRREAAFLGSWELVMHAAAKLVGARSAAQLRSLAPCLFAEAEAVADALRERWGVAYRFSVEASFAAPRAKVQSKIHSEVAESILSRLSGAIDDRARAVVRSAGGPAAGAFLSAPSSPDEPRVDCAALAAVLRARLLLPHPGFDPSHAHGGAHTCNKRPAAAPRNLCGAPLDALGHHAAVCPVGGGVIRWHNVLRDSLRSWISELVGSTVPTEQLVPAWCTEAREAILDIGPFHPRLGGRTYVDVTYGSVTTPATPAGDADARERAANDGVKARRLVSAKRHRYPPEHNPGATLVPFALEAHGRWSDDALAFVQHMLPADHPDRAAELSRVHRAVSVLTMSRLGDQLIAAEASAL